MSKLAKETKYLYMLDEFQRDVAKRERMDGEDVLRDISVGMGSIAGSAAVSMNILFAAVDAGEINMVELIGAVANILWDVAKVSERLGVQLSDVAGYAVDKHDDQQTAG